MEKESFDTIKNKYNEARREEQNTIVGYFKTLQHEGYELERPAARRGVRNYKAQGRLEEEYDLSNWMWVCVKRNNVHFFISLQAFERDSKTGNFHVLTDRIGIYAYVGFFSPQDAQTKMLITNIDLPMNEKKLDELANIIKDMSECDRFRIQLEFEDIKSRYGLV